MPQIKINETHYPTELCKVWPRMKELRRQHFRELWESQKKGAPMIIGGGGHGYMRGIGDFGNATMGPHFTIMMRDHAENLKCQEAMEAYGWTRDLCSAYRVHVGQLLRGIATKGPHGETVTPNFVWGGGGCHSPSKAQQFYTEQLGVPFYQQDRPHEDTPEGRQYLYTTLAEGIEWMEKLLGKKYDDEAAIEGTKNDWMCRAYMNKVYELQKTIPAPWDKRHLWSLRLPGFTMSHKPEVVEYFHELLDETKDRVARGVSARGYEKIRLMHDGIPTFPNISTLRYPQVYGGIIIGSPLLFATMGLHHHMPDGRWIAVGTLEEEKREIRTRDEMLWTMVDMGISLAWHAMSCCHTRPEEIVALLRDWKCDALVLHEDLGCKAEQTAMAEGKLAAQRAGYPTMVYEASQSDPRDFSKATVFDRFDAFLESFGLSKIETGEIKAEADDSGAGGAGDLHYSG